MKTFLPIVFLLVTVNVFAQKHPFVRVFTNTNGKTGKTVRGKLTAITDSSIIVKGKTISYHDISSIGLKRSFGNTFITTLGATALSGAAVGTLAAVLDGSKGSNDGGALTGPSPFYGFAIGMPTGIVLGMTLGALRQYVEIPVNNDLHEWIAAKKILLEKMK